MNAQVALLLLAECHIRGIRGGGKGGQHVNKVSTTAELVFSPSQSTVLTAGQKSILDEKLKSRLSQEGFLRITSGEERSLAMNVEKVKKKFISLIQRSLSKPRPRKPTRPTISSREKRLKEKKIRSEIKRSRQH